MSLTYHFCGDVFVNESVIEVVGLADIKTAVDLDLEVLTIGIVQETTVLVKLKRLPLSAFLEQIFASGITDRGLLL